MQQFAHVQAQFGTDLTRRLTADLNSRELDALGGTALRLNVMGQEAVLRGATSRRFGGLALRRRCRSG